MATYQINYPRTASPLIVTAKFIPGYPDTMDQPGDPDGAEITSILCDGAELIDIVEDQEYDEMQELWISAHYSAMPQEID